MKKWKIQLYRMVLIVINLRKNKILLIIIKKVSLLKTNGNQSYNTQKTQLLTTRNLILILNNSKISTLTRKCYLIISFLSIMRKNLMKKHLIAKKDKDNISNLSINKISQQVLTIFPQKLFFLILDFLSNQSEE